jgi:hypothetical protein
LARAQFAYFCPYCGTKTRTAQSLRVCPACGRQIVPPPRRDANRFDPWTSKVQSSQNERKDALTVVVLASELVPILQKWIDNYNAENGIKLKEDGSLAVSTLGRLTGQMALCEQLGWSQRQWLRAVNESFYFRDWDHILTTMGWTHYLYNNTIHLIEYKEVARMKKGEHMILNRAQAVALGSIAIQHGMDIKMEIIGGGSAKRVFDAPVQAVVTTPNEQYRYNVAPDGTRRILGLTPVSQS